MDEKGEGGGRGGKEEEEGKEKKRKGRVAISTTRIFGNTNLKEYRVALVAVREPMRQISFKYFFDD